MSVELLQTLSLISYLIAGLLLLLVIVLFFTMKIPALFGEVSGRTAKKAIRSMRWNMENEEARNSAQLAQVESVRDGRLVAREQKAPLIKTPLPVATEQKPSPKPEAAATEVVEVPVLQEIAKNQAPRVRENKTEHTSVLPPVESAQDKTPSARGETSVLNVPSETSVLTAQGETAVLNNQGETAVLSAAGETSVLGSTGELLPITDTTVLTAAAKETNNLSQAKSVFSLEFERSFMESTEIIE